MTDLGESRLDESLPGDLLDIPYTAVRNGVQEVCSANGDPIG
ncbi:MAG: hypothetical protein R2705_00150 [Ilumatobacteraceae bacterium]